MNCQPFICDECRKLDRNWYDSCPHAPQQNGGSAGAASAYKELLSDMYEELKPGPTGGNDYSDAWQVFGERLTAAAEGRLTYFTAPVTPGSAGLRVTGEQFKAAYWAGYKGPAEEMWNRMANALNASSLDAPAFLSGLGNETVAEFDARELAAAPP